MSLNTTVDNLCVYDIEFQYLADRFVNELGSNSAVHPVKTMDDLKAALNNYNGVKFLEICLHGTPGMLYLNNQTALVGAYLNTLAVNPLFLQKNARVLFDSCSIGEGTTGDKFMNTLGTGLLKGRGGFIGATTVTNTAFPLLPWTGVYMKPLSFGRLKIRKYDTDGNLIGSQTVDRHGIIS